MHFYKKDEEMLNNSAANKGVKSSYLHI